jgi:hypothetical protein
MYVVLKVCKRVSFINLFTFLDFLIVVGVRDRDQGLKAETAEAFGIMSGTSVSFQASFAFPFERRRNQKPADVRRGRRASFVDTPRRAESP